MSTALRTAGAALAGAWVFLSSSGWSRAHGGVESELLALEHHGIEATIRGDADAFAAFMADDDVAVVANARIRSKAEWVESVRSGGLQYAIASGFSRSTY